MPNDSAIHLSEARSELEAAVAEELGRLVMAFGDFVTGLYLGVAWVGAGAELEKRVGESQDKDVQWLINRIVRRSKEVFPAGSEGRTLYARWSAAAHALRAERNCLVHSRWGLEPAHGVAVAISSPILVEPIKQRRIAPSEIRELAVRALALRTELSKLRESHPL